MPKTIANSAFQTISQLAGQPAVHRAFQWFHLQEPQLREWHRQVAAIAAPPFGETARAIWVTEQFAALGLEDITLDACGNALGWMRPGDDTQGKNAQEFRPCMLFSAHLDTVFPAEAIGEPVQDGNRLKIPGASDNCAGITALLGIAAGMRAAGLKPASDILFACNVGEEGEGNLRGMRHIFSEAHIATRIRFAVILDGAGTDTIVTQGLGSKRFRITVTGPGGHSWTDAGTPNPILVLANALAEIGRLELPNSSRTTWNIGHVEGGTSINAIPQRAEARVDTRSTDAKMLAQLEEAIYEAVEIAVAMANRGGKGAGGNARANPIQFSIEPIGERPAATLPDDARILTILKAVDRHLQIQSHTGVASTDANIPLSLGVEAISLGSGGSGGGIHSLQEWFDATGRDLALRRILLLLLALAQTEI
ncbi:MAG TPA: M20/M25/M40 family metallo-hydrolase [Acidobacteriaceae bacterium]|nr:M20/M25/M40 family metallo-hydrolase [Acidobacteriaceae bacterium]